MKNRRLNDQQQRACTMVSAGEENSIGNWAELVPDILILIAKRIHLYEDFVSFSGVCRPWRSVAVKENFNHSASSSVQIPWLMLAEEEEGGSETRRFASLTKGGMVHRVDLREARGRHCKSSMGWLITTDKHGDTELLHPLSRARIPLPHPTSYKYYENGREMISDKFLVRRAVLSASPSVTKDYVVMVILGWNGYAAFWKPGNDSWTLVEPHPSVCLDVIYYKNQFLTINRASYSTQLRGGQLLLCNPNTGAAETVGLVPHFAIAIEEQHAYLVESVTGDLLFVRRVLDIHYFTYDDQQNYTDGDDEDNYIYYTRSFKIYKFDSTDMNDWDEINDLQGASIFVGHSAARAVLATASAGIKPNCIYFTDDYVDGYVTTANLIGGNDMGIYNLGTRTVEPIVVTPLSNHCPPIWVLPSF